MKKETFSNIDRAILETPTNPSREYIQKMLEKYMPENRKEWAKELENAKDYEELLISMHSTEGYSLMVNLVMQERSPDECESDFCNDDAICIDDAILFYFDGVDSLFDQMHHVAYFEGLVNMVNPKIAEDYCS